MQVVAEKRTRNERRKFLSVRTSQLVGVGGECDIALSLSSDKLCVEFASYGVVVSVRTLTTTTYIYRIRKGLNRREEEWMLAGVANID